MIELYGSRGEQCVPSGNGGGVGERSCRARLTSLEEQAFLNLWPGSLGTGASLSERDSSCLLAQAKSDILASLSELSRP